MVNLLSWKGHKTKRPIASEPTDWGDEKKGRLATLEVVKDNNDLRDCIYLRVDCTKETQHFDNNQ